mmetsp:Transcript_9384/g.34783  ORF Transcript_9384/g.34783 Transcript_9384/m.34783 type:complete len:144 (+) Transcript_9384:2-433(+)
MNQAFFFIHSSHVYFGIELCSEGQSDESSAHCGNVPKRMPGSNQNTTHPSTTQNNLPTQPHCDIKNSSFSNNKNFIMQKDCLEDSILSSFNVSPSDRIRKRMKLQIENNLKNMSSSNLEATTPLSSDIDGQKIAEEFYSHTTM